MLEPAYRPSHRHLINQQALNQLNLFNSHLNLIGFSFPRFYSLLFDSRMGQAIVERELSGLELDDNGILYQLRFRRVSSVSRIPNRWRSRKLFKLVIFAFLLQLPTT